MRKLYGYTGFTAITIFSAMASADVIHQGHELIGSAIFLLGVVGATLFIQATELENGESENV